MFVELSTFEISAVPIRATAVLPWSQTQYYRPVDRHKKKTGWIWRTPLDKNASSTREASEHISYTRMRKPLKASSFGSDEHIKNQTKPRILYTCPRTSKIHARTRTRESATNFRPSGQLHMKGLYRADRLRRVIGKVFARLATLTTTWGQRKN